MTDSPNSRPIIAPKEGPVDPLRRRNHWVPADYLSAFTEDGTRKGLLTVYGRDDPPRPFRQLVENVAHERDLYVVKRPDGVLDDSIERFLADHIELPFGPVRNKLAFGPRVGVYRRLTAVERDRLLHYVAFLQVRTPAMRADLNHALTFQATTAARAALRRPGLGQGKDGQPISEEVRARASRLFEEGKIVAAPTDTGWLQFALPLALSLVEDIRFLPWRVLDAPAEVSLPTTDAPIVVSSRDGRGGYHPEGGWLLLNSEVVLPLAPRCVLVFGHGVQSWGDLGTPAWWAGLRQRIIRSATRWVYSPSPAPDIPAVLAQSVPPRMVVRYPGGKFSPGDSPIEAVRRMMDLHPSGTIIGFGRSTD